jgi:hypothetical protein
MGGISFTGGMQPNAKTKAVKSGFSVVTNPPMIGRIIKENQKRSGDACPRNSSAPRSHNKQFTHHSGHFRIRLTDSSILH